MAGDFVERWKRRAKLKTVSRAHENGKRRWQATTRSQQKSISTSSEHKSSPRRAAEANGINIGRCSSAEWNFSSFIYLSSRLIRERLRCCFTVYPRALCDIIKSTFCAFVRPLSLLRSENTFHVILRLMLSARHELLLRCVSSPTQLLARLSGDLHHGFRLD